MTRAVRLLVLGESGSTRADVAALEEAGYEIERLNLDPGVPASPAIDWSEWDLVLALPNTGAQALSGILRGRESAENPAPLLLLGGDSYPQPLALSALMAVGLAVPDSEAGEPAAEEPGPGTPERHLRTKRDYEQVRRYSAYLEHLVRERTSELQAANRRIRNEMQVHRMTARALRESEQRFRTIAENAPDLIFRFDRNLRHVYVNPRVVDLTGKQPQGFIGKTMEESGVPEEVCLPVNEALRKVFSTGKSRRIDFRYPSPRGRRHLQATLSPEFSDEGEVGAVVGISRDFTDIKRAEEELKRDRETLQDEVEEKTEALVAARLALAEAERLRQVGKLAATVAHELRNPLGVIRAAAYNVRRKRSNAEIDRHLDTIDDKIEESALIIENLLDYSRVRQPDPEKVDVKRLVEESARSVRSQFGSSDVRIDSDLEDVAGVEAELDATQMGRVISNLLTNACQALSEGSGRVVVRARADREASTLMIEVQDDGVGMTPEELEQAFEPFFTCKARGAGLGLTICRDVVSRHGGTVDMRSTRDGGTIVTVQVPLRRCGGGQ